MHARYGVELSAVTNAAERQTKSKGVSEIVKLGLQLTCKRLVLRLVYGRGLNEKQIALFRRIQALPAALVQEPRCASMLPGFTANIPDSVMSLTFIAFGVSLPDVVASVLVVRDGKSVVP